MAGAHTHGKAATMELGYQGGVCDAGVSVIDAREAWSFPAHGRHFFVRATGCARMFVWDAMALLIRGYARPAGSSTALNLEVAAEETRAHYLEYGDLAV